MSKGFGRRLAVLVGTVAVVAAWWTTVTYALGHWQMLAKVTVIGAVSFLAYVCVRLVDHALTLQKFSLRAFFKQDLLKKNAIRVVLVLAVLMGIREAGSASTPLMVIALVGVSLFNVFKWRKSWRDLAVLGLLFAGAAVFYLGTIGALSLGTIFGWALFAIAILGYLFFPEDIASKDRQR